MIEDKILVACWKTLDKMKVGNVLVIQHFAPNKPDLFIDCAKQYIKVYKNLLFNKDYTEIYKVYSFKEVENQFNKIIINQKP